jgi:hypothetical protein
MEARLAERRSPAEELSGGGIMSEPRADLQGSTTAELMEDVRSRIRAKHAGQAVDDDLAAIMTLLQQALDLADSAGPLLIDELNDDDQERVLKTHLRFSTHRPLFGGLLVAVKRRVLLPLVRWLFEYSQDNFRRQNKINRLMFAYMQVAVAENVRLRRDLELLRPAAATDPDAEEVSSS